MYIFVEALTGMTIRVRVEPGDSIQSIKHKIMVCEDLPIEEQNLIFQEVNLDNDKSLKDYRIGPGSTLRLVMKMKGGPLSAEEGFSESENLISSNGISDYLAIMLFENGDYKFVPMYGLDKQNPKLKQTKDDLNDEDIFSTINVSQSEHKITILKLKMDYAKLNRKMSSLQSQSKIQTSINKDDEPQFNYKHVNPMLCRSMSLDSKLTGLVPDLYKSNKKLKNQNTSLTSRMTTLGTYRRMSVLDGKYSSTLPSLQNDPETHQNNFHISETTNLVKSRLRLPSLKESEENKKNIVTPRRCPVCSKRLTLTNEFTCRCGGLFCMKHRYPEEHKCIFDFKSAGQLELLRSNPIVKSIKITKI